MFKAPGAHCFSAVISGVDFPNLQIGIGPDEHEVIRFGHNFRKAGYC